MVKLAALREELNAGLSRSSRLRAGVWAILLLIVLYFVLVVADLSDELSSQYQQQYERLIKVQKLQGQDFWQERRRHELAINQKLLTRMRRAESESLARADLQVEIEEVLRLARLRSPSISMGTFEPMQDLEGVQKLSAQINAQLNKGSALELLKALAEIQSLLTVERFDMTLDRNRRVQMQITAYFQIAGVGA